MVHESTQAMIRTPCMNDNLDNSLAASDIAKQMPIRTIRKNAQTLITARRYAVVVRYATEFFLMFLDSSWAKAQESLPIP